MSDTPPNLPNAKTLFYLIDKCVTIGVLSVVSWALWSYIEKTNSQRDEEMKELRRAVSECTSSKSERVENKVDGIQEKVDGIQAGIQEILRRERR